MDTDVVVATADAELLDAARRWCGAVGVTAHACHDVDGLRRAWRTADQVLLGEDLVAAVRSDAFARRDHVRVVTHDPDPYWRAAVELGAVAVLRADDDARAVESLAQALDDRAEGCSLVVVGGTGGVGSTTFAVALCHAALRRGLTAVVIDADPVAAGIDLVAGTERAPGLRWSALTSDGGRVAARSLTAALPISHGLATVSWGLDQPAPLPSGASGVWSGAVRAFELVVVDQPRTGAGDQWDSVVVGGSVLSVVVVADDVVGLSGARRQVAALGERTDAVAAVVVSQPRGLGRKAVEDALGAPVVAAFRRDRRLRVAIDHGRGPQRSRRLMRPAAALLDLVGLDR